MRHDIVLFVPPVAPDFWRRSFSSLNQVLKDHGLNSTVIDLMSWSPDISCSISVALGGHKPATERGQVIGRLMEHQKQAGDRHIVTDLGFIYRRSEYWSVGWDALNGRANFCNKNMDSKRIDKWGIKLQPWKVNKSGCVLFCLQLPWDAAVVNTHYPTYIKNTVEALLSSSQRDIVIREHPKISEGGCAQTPIAHEYSAIVQDALKNDRVTRTGSTLKEDFDNAWCVVSYNSNSTVEAAIYGVPSFVSDKGSMSWDVSGHDLNIENPILPERHQWLCDLSYTQWNGDEIAKGIPFRQIGVIT